MRLPVDNFVEIVPCTARGPRSSVRPLPERAQILVVAPNRSNNILTKM